MTYWSGKHECSVCGAMVDVTSAKRPQIVVKCAAGKQSVRVVRVAGKEIHRCGSGYGSFAPTFGR